MGRLLQISGSLYRYRTRRPSQEALRLRMRELAQARPRFGYRRIHVLLLRDGWRVNMKRCDDCIGSMDCSCAFGYVVASGRAFTAAFRRPRAERMSAGAWTLFTMH